MKIISLIIGILVCFGIPIAGTLWIRKKSKIPVGRSFLVGALAFTISQICIRLPLLQLVLPKMAWFQILQYRTIGFGIFIGVTAGIFEEGARWIAIKFCMKKRWSREDGLVFGLGHGGIEAMLLMGVNYVIHLGLNLTGNSMADSLSSSAILVGSVERIFAITFHVGASLLVMRGIRSGKALWYVLLAILLHTIVDAMAVIGPELLGFGSVAMECYVAFWAVVTLGLGLYSYHKFNRADNSNFAH